MAELPENKLYYSITEVAAYLEVNASLIRFWEKEFDFIQPKKNKKGNRLFTKEDIEHLSLVYNLVKERGYTLEGARKKLKDDRHRQMENVEIVQSLKRIKTFLLELRGQL